MKTMSILSIIFSVIFFLFIIMGASSGGEIRGAELGLIGIPFGLWSIAFSIVSIVNSYKKTK